MNLPYALQLAYGWTKLAFYINMIAVIVLVPAIYFSTMHWGVVGAAGVWIVLNGAYLIVAVQIMHRHLLVNEKWRWYLSDVVKLLAVALVVTSIAKWIMKDGYGTTQTIMALIIVWGVATFATFICAESLRKYALSWRFMRAW